MGPCGAPVTVPAGDALLPLAGTADFVRLTPEPAAAGRDDEAAGAGKEPYYFVGPEDGRGHDGALLRGLQLRPSGADAEALAILPVCALCTGCRHVVLATVRWRWCCLGGGVVLVRH